MCIRDRYMGSHLIKYNQETAMDSDAAAILEKVRKGFQTRGVRSLNDYSRRFMVMDTVSRTKSLDSEELLKGLREAGISLTQAESDTLLRHLDTDGNGSVNFHEFLTGIRANLTGPRKTLVDRVYNKLDKDGSGVINSDDLRGVYSAKRHPKVVKGEKTEDQVFKEFLTSLGDTNGDGQLTRQEFYNYYQALSSSIDDDAYFEQVLTNSWKL
eukprot:TRINITY_DN12521_c0_g1_i10.p1 TRINITY_DN12521_c0_g1~~TRINITY_DN12521_c0_g1_i10.p1  ORF type:complete len:212 (+),score=56.16 TRINITY_DN12521_c0_g1_i10:65-700(+)